MTDQPHRLAGIKSDRRTAVALSNFASHEVLTALRGCCISIRMEWGDGVPPSEQQDFEFFLNRIDQLATELERRIECQSEKSRTP